MIGIKVKVDSRGLKVNQDHQLEERELHQGFPAEIMTDVSVIDSLITLPKAVL